MRGSGPRMTRILDRGMAAPKALKTTSPASEPDAAVQSALRTLEAEGSGIAALTAALQSDLGAPFGAAVKAAPPPRGAGGRGTPAPPAALQSDPGAPFGAATELIRGAAGRLIITGLGKSGHIGRKIAATFASTGTPASFVHAAEASH